MSPHYLSTVLFMGSTYERKFIYKVTAFTVFMINFHTNESAEENGLENQ